MINGLSFKILKSKNLTQLKGQLSSLQTEINEALSFVQNLDQDDTGELTQKNKESELMNALGSLHSKLKESSVRDLRSKWITEGLNKFIDILKSDGSTQELYDRLIASTVRYVNANQGGIYILNSENEEDKFLELRACYAYERKKYIEKRIDIGEGLVGQCIFEKDVIYLTDVPQDYVNITSGLGMATPRNIIVLPLIYNEEVLGVLELASFHVMEDFQVDFLKRLAENIGFSINDLNNAERTEKLLKESRQNAEQMKAQEEMMIQSMEELQATQEEMARNQKYLKASERRNKVYFEHANYGIIAFNSLGTIDDANQQAISIFETSIDEIKGKSMDDLLIGFKTRNLERFVNNNKRVQITKADGRRVKIEITINEVEVDDRQLYVAYINGDISGDIKKEKELARSLMEMDEQKRFMEIKQKELENSQRLSQAFFENSNDAIITCSEEGDLFEVNAAAVKLLQIEKDQAIDENLNTFIPKLDLSKPARFLNKRNKIKIRKKSGDELKAELFLAQEAINGMTIFIAYIRDISGELIKQRGLARSLMELDELKTRLDTYKLN